VSAKNISTIRALFTGQNAPYAFIMRTMHPGHRHVCDAIDISFKEFQMAKGNNRDKKNTKKPKKAKKK
jgi:hypothetical protein